MSGMVALATPDRRLRRNVIFTKKALKMAREYTDRREAQVVGEYEAAK